MEIASSVAPAARLTAARLMRTQGSRPSLDECSQARDRLADDQSVHLSSALVGIDRLGIGHEASDVVLEQDAVAAEQLARIADGLATFDRAERLGERCMLIAHHVFVLKLGETQHH